MSAKTNSNLRPTEDPTNVVLSFLQTGKSGSKAKFGDLRVAKDAPPEYQQLNGLRVVVTDGMVMIKARGSQTGGNGRF